MALVGVDWGSTSLRAYLIESPGVVSEVLEEVGSGAIATSAGGAEAFAATLDRLFKSGASSSWLAPETPVLLCGMVGSRQGWKEVAYRQTPASAADIFGSTVEVALVDGRKASILPGLCHPSNSGSAPDVMRGEETQLLGAAKEGEASQVFVLPGTHSKWVRIQSGKIQSFQTQMTGEVFEVLKQHSILGKLMTAGEEDWSAFEAGLSKSRESGGLLSHLFACRTEGLANAFAPDALPSFLSGILIGHELRDATESGWSILGGVTLVGGQALCERYRRAFAFLCGIQAQLILGQDAVAKGLWKVHQLSALEQALVNTQSDWDRALSDCPCVAILRGVTPAEVVAIGEAVVEAGIRIVEVPMNSPDAISSVKLLADNLPGHVIVGAGTVLTAEQVVQVAQAGGKLIVSPNANQAVIQAAKQHGLICLPGVCTPTEAFAALQWGASGLKAFPCEQLPPKVLKAWRAVLPKGTCLIAVGGINADNMQTYWDAGCNGFGFGSNLYAPAAKPQDVKDKATLVVSQCRAYKARKVGGA